MTERVVIIGCGQAGGAAAAALREQGHAGDIVLIGDEGRLPYQRPPLSKDYLAGKMPVERLYMKQPAFYQEKTIELKLAARAERIDRGAASVHLADGAAIVYDKLLLATGSRPRRIDIPGAALPGVHYLRTLADVEHIRADMAPDKRMVVIGGGYIGLEAAAVGVQCGLKVTLLEGADRILGRVAGPEISAFFTHEHREHGVDVRCGARIQSLRGKDRIEAVVCADGEIAADLVIVGIGIVPNVELAVDAGLACDNGIVVDEHARTADPRIYAAGDCTNHPNAVVGRRLRLESVQNALDQARAAAGNICGNPKVYAELPWFWSNQYDLRLQIAGLSQGYDQTVVRGDPASRSFSVMYLQAGTLIAADTVNAPKEHLALRKLIAQKTPIAVERLADTSAAF